MQLETLLRLCRAYRALGDAVAAQLDDVADGDPVSIQNPNAMTLAACWLDGARRAGVSGAADLLDSILSDTPALQ